MGGAQDLLRWQEVQEAPGAQGHPVQGRQGLELRPGQAPIRLQADGFRWSDQARLPQEGQDHPYVVLRLECKKCKTKKQLTLKRTKHFELVLRRTMVVINIRFYFIGLFKI